MVTTPRYIWSQILLYWILVSGPCIGEELCCWSIAIYTVYRDVILRPYHSFSCKNFQIKVTNRGSVVQLKHLKNLLWHVYCCMCVSRVYRGVEEAGCCEEKKKKKEKPLIFYWHCENIEFPHTVGTISTYSKHTAARHRCAHTTLSLFLWSSFSFTCTHTLQKMWNKSRTESTWNISYDVIKELS